MTAYLSFVLLHEFCLMNMRPVHFLSFPQPVLHPVDVCKCPGMVLAGGKHMRRDFSLSQSLTYSFFFVVLFKLTFLLSRGSFLLAISKVQFNQLFLMALERNKWARPWAELRTITSTSTRALSRSVN